MSNILKTIKDDLLYARKNKMTNATTFLSTLIGEIEAKAYAGSQKIELTDEHAIAAIKSYIKKTSEFLSLEGIEEDVKEKLERELEILEGYLPTQLSETEIRNFFNKIVSEVENVKLGDLMKALKSEYNGLYDAVLASQIAKEFL